MKMKKQRVKVGEFIALVNYNDKDRTDSNFTPEMMQVTKIDKKTGNFTTRYVFNRMYSHKNGKLSKSDERFEKDLPRHFDAYGIPTYVQDFHWENSIAMTIPNTVKTLVAEIKQKLATNAYEAKDWDFGFGKKQGRVAYLHRTIQYLQIFFGQVAGVEYDYYGSVKEN